MSFVHDVVTGAFTCLWCEREFAEPTRRAALREGWDGTLIGLVDEYSHVCTEPWVTHPAVIVPFPDQRDELLRRMREAFPPVEEAA